MYGLPVNMPGEVVDMNILMVTGQSLHYAIHVGLKEGGNTEGAVGFGYRDIGNSL